MVAMEIEKGIFPVTIAVTAKKENASQKTWSLWIANIRSGGSKLRVRGQKKYTSVYLMFSVLNLL